MLARIVAMARLAEKTTQPPLFLVIAAAVVAVTVCLITTGK